MLIALYVCFYIEYRRDKQFFSLKNDSFGRILTWCLIWTFLVFLGTGVFGQDSWLFAFKMYRVYLLLPSYFLLRKLTMDDMDQYFKMVLKLSIIQGIFFYLQLVGVTGILSGYGATLEEGESILSHRFGNYPSFSFFFFIYFIIKNDVSIFKRVLNIVFWGMMPIVGQMRGGLISLFVACGIYFVFQLKAKDILYLIVGIVAYQLVVVPMFSMREKDYELSTADEIKLVVQNPLSVYKIYTGSSDEGTFVFRISIYEERIAYLIEHPQYLLQGVGCIHEDSPKNRFKFDYGTITKMEDGTAKTTMLSSADIVWIGIIMHFGLVGVFLFTLLYYYYIKQSLPLVKNSKNVIFIVYACSSIGSYTGTFNSEAIGRVTMVTSILLAVAIVSIYRREQNILN